VKRILYHHRTQADDGQAVHVRALIGAFRAAGHEVLEVGLVRHGTDAAPSARKRSGPGWGLVTRAPRFVREVAEYAYTAVGRQRILSAAVHFEPDFLYERHAFGNAAGVLAARRLGRPLVLEVNAPMVLELERTRGLVFPGLARRLESFVLREADRVCAVTGVLRDMLVARGADPERVLVTPNGVDLAAYDHADPAAVRAAARADLGLPAEEAGELVLGFVGHYRRWHRLDVALDALGDPSLAHARLVVIGAGPAHDDLVRQAQRAGIASRVHFPGTRPHGSIPRLLAAFDVALLPAINPYASPLKLHEYMAARLPVIAPDQENLREVLEDGRDALLVPPDDADALRAAILELATDPRRAAELGARARRTVEERDLTWAGNVRRVLAAVEELG